MYKKDSHFIPSPFKAVNQYEDQFVKEWNESAAKAVAELLKYIAAATAYAIKNNDFQTTEFEKAHNVGDIHPNGLWVWSEYRPGKFDWRVMKKSKKPNIWEMNPDIDKLKTSKECQDFVSNLGYISYSSDISKADLKSAKLICSALVNLYDLIPYERIKIKMRKLKKAPMQACDGALIEINSDCFTNFNPSRYWHDTNDKYLANNKRSLDYINDTIKSTLKNNPKADVRKLTQTRDKLAETIAKCPRWTYGDEYTLAADIVLHELGHILNSQCSGACGHHKQPIYATSHTKAEISTHIQLNAERDSIYKKYCNENRVISEYSTTKPAEFFAECFVAWLHKDKGLPKYVSDYYDKYFSQTTPKR